MENDNNFSDEKDVSIEERLTFSCDKLVSGYDTIIIEQGEMLRNKYISSKKTKVIKQLKMYWLENSKTAPYSFKINKTRENNITYWIIKMFSEAFCKDPFMSAWFNKNEMILVGNDEEK